MIRLSLYRSLAMHGLLALLLLLLAPLAGGGCDLSKSCTAIGCLDGLTITFAGNIDPNATLRIDLARRTAGEPVPFMACMSSPTGTSGRLTQCNSALNHTELGTAVIIHDTTLTELMVTVSESGTVLVEDSFTAAYTTREINGPGCGTCTSGSHTVTVP
jgi:hypothetical protein